MSAPFTPDDFKACISDPSSGLCTNFVNTLLKLPVLVWKLVNYLFDSSGNPTKALVNASQPTGSYIFSAVPLTEDGTRLLADGRTLLTATYPDLSAALGGNTGPYGTVAAGSFKLPDFRGFFPVGIGNFVHAGAIVAGTPVGADQVTLDPTQQGSLDITITEDDGDAQTGARVSIETIKFNSTTFGDAGSLATQGPTNVKLKADASPFNIIPPGLGCYIYIVT